jgi:hypothetical protein
MNLRKLAKIERELRGLLTSGAVISRARAEGLARKLERTRDDHQGKEPTYVRHQDPKLRPLTIPGHSGDLKRGTSRNILSMLLDDVAAWQIELEGAVDGDRD